jgi:hypothetical protein
MRRVWIILKRGFLFFVVAVAMIVAGLFAHEMGHVITVEALGGTWDTLNVAPGFTIYPFDQIGRTDWNGHYVAWVTYHWDGDWPNLYRGLVSLAGSLTTALLSILGLVVLYVLRPRGLLRWAAVVLACFLFGDMLRYGTLATIGPREYLRNPGQAPPVTCAEGVATPTYRVPADVVEPQLYLYRISCEAGRPTIYFTLVGTADVERCTPVFFEVDTPGGRTWAVTEYDESQTCENGLFYYRSDTGDGVYSVRMAYVVVNGLRTSLLWGGAHPEPLAGAVQMGVPPWLFLHGVVLLSLVQGGLLAAYLLRLRRRRQHGPATPLHLPLDVVE